MKYRFISDAGHGWLEVPVGEVRGLGIEDEISKYSYINEDYVYLEEDVDIMAYISRKSSSFMERDVEFIDINGYSEIRQYDRYDKILV